MKGDDRGSGDGILEPMTREVRTLLRLEGLLVLAIGIVFYARLEGSWPLFALLFLVPDVSMIGYLSDRKIGARVYNAAHAYLGPVLLGAGAYWVESPLAGQIALIWICHIGFDRLWGFGLKYPSGFGDTHLGVTSSATRNR